MNRRPLWLAVVGVVLFLFLGGPTPGSVGDCAAGESFADPVEHCQNKLAWTCARRSARGDISPAENMACLSRVPIECAPANWPPGCTPSQQESDACIAALMNPDTLGTPGQCFPDGASCGSPPMLGPGCEACDQPVECSSICAASGALISGGDSSDTGDGGAGL
ncbi:MAG: hypothetical protein JRH11_07780 [Deltaproteobacteria bacterium]|nr:hypothetical protein [Deltaproteobacteria bacterium]